MGIDPLHEGDGEEDALSHARSVLSASREGVLLFGEQHTAVKFVTDHQTGRLIVSVPAAVLLATDHTLAVPEDSDDALQLLVTPEQVEESVSTDRWMAFHGTPEHVRWAELWVESAKHGAWVFDGEAFMLPNALAPAEPSLCKRLNADKAALARVCQRYAGVVVPSPTCVGVDPAGLYVRAAFGVVRVSFDRGARDGDDAAAVIDAMVKSC